jgi:hypothetical protein
MVKDSVTADPDTLELLVKTVQLLPLDQRTTLFNFSYLPLNPTLGLAKGKGSLWLCQGKLKRGYTPSPKFTRKTN